MKEIKGKLQLKSISFKGQILWAGEKDVFIAANQSVKVLAKSIWEMGIKSTKEDFVYASLKMKEGQIESHLLIEPERNLKFPSRQFERKVHQSKDGLEIELYSPVFVRSVILEMLGENVEFSDNFFDLVPGAKKRVRLTCSSEKGRIIRDRLNIG